MAKEFDIYLNNRLTECDIMVYSIPFRDGITAIHRMILESCIESYTLQKFVALQTHSELVQHIDKMLKTCYEKLSLCSELDASASFHVHYTASETELPLELTAEKIEALSNMFTTVESAIEMGVSPATFYTGVSGGSGSSSIEIAAEVAGDTKYSLLTISPSLEPESQILGTEKRGCLEALSDAIVDSDLVNLCYRFYTGASTIAEIASEVLGTEIHFSFGHADSSMEMSAEVTGGEFSQKMLSLENVVESCAEVIESVRQFMHPELHSIAIGIVVDPILKRHRLLSEMDADNLSAYDDMLLEEIDYVII